MKKLQIHTNLLKFCSIHLYLIFILCLSFGMGLYFLIQNPGDVFQHPEQFSKGVSTYGSLDAYRYATMTWQLIHEGIYGYNSTHSNAFVTPGQPMILFVIFSISTWIHVDHLLLTKLVFMVLMLATNGLIYMIARALFTNKWIAILASFLYAFYFPQYHFFRTTLTEIPSMFFFMLSVYGYIKAMKNSTTKNHILFGVFASITLMIRPTPAPILLFAYGMVLYKMGIKEGIKIGLLWVVGPLFFIFPWVVRNILSLGHVYLFSSHGGDTLLDGVSPFAQTSSIELANQAKKLGIEPGEYAKRLISEGFKNDLPLWLSWFTVGKITQLFIRPDSLNMYVLYIPWKIVDAFNKVHNVLVIGSLLSVIVYFKDVRIKKLSIVVFMYIGLSLMFICLPRYGFFIMPLMTLICSFGIVKTAITVRDITKKFTTTRKQRS